MNRKLHLLLKALIAAVWLGSQVSAQAAEVSATVKDASGVAVSDAVVLFYPKRGNIPATKITTEEIDQVDKEFVPYVKVVMVGTPINFTNKDNVRHHVYSFSETKKFELMLYSGTPSKPVVFDKPGVVTVGCNIHDWMLAYIYVSETPYFGKTGADGKVQIGNLPTGDYIARIWHPRMAGAEETTAQNVNAGKNPADVSWAIKLKPEFRVHRPAMKSGY